MVDADQAVLELILTRPAIQALLSEISGANGKGRPGYPAEAKFLAFCVKYLNALPTTRALIHELRTSPGMFRLCRFERKIGPRSRRTCEHCLAYNRDAKARGSPRRKCVCRKQNKCPAESTFSKFFRKLLGYEDLIVEAINEVVELLSKEVSGFGKIVIIDSTDIDAYAHPNRKVIADADATWGVRKKKRSPPRWTGERNPPEDVARQELEPKTEHFFGFKLHTLIDAETWTSLASIVLPANEDETTRLPLLFSMARDRFPEVRPRYLIADRGYDSLRNHEVVYGEGTIPIIHIRKPSAGRLHSGIYTTKGSPTCMGGKTMTFVRTAEDTGHHLYRCPRAGCDRRGKIRGWSTCNDQHWEDPMDNLRIISVIARASRLWKRLYRRRTDIDRMFGSMKRSRLLNDLYYIGLPRTRLHVAFAQLTYASTVMMNFRSAGKKNMRHMSVREK